MSFQPFLAGSTDTGCMELPSRSLQSFDLDLWLAKASVPRMGGTRDESELLRKNGNVRNGRLLDDGGAGDN